MKKIWRFELPFPPKEPDDVIEVEMPLYSPTLTIQMQDDTLCIWALVDPSAEKVTRRFRIYGTGWEIPHERTLHEHYLQTVQIGPMVWHVFEVAEKV